MPSLEHLFLPRILGFRLTGFQPKLSQDPSMRLQPGPNIVLGGNGLGKTTIMQAVIYAFTGGLTLQQERDKKQRWDHRYFRKRLERDRLRMATVEVDFALGTGVFSIRRQFLTAEVSAFRSSPEAEWIMNGDGAAEELERALQLYGGYRSSDDFAFIFHRLLYLPESRRLLAWDTDAQVRLLMLLSPGMIDEESFQRRRAELKKTDSAKRHAHVAAGHLKEQLKDTLPEDVVDSGRKQEESPQPIVRDLGSILELLQRATTERQAEEKKTAEIARELSERSEEVESLREEIEMREASIVALTLAQTEAEDNLALKKLTDNGICPACGELAPELQAAAQRNANADACVLCGTKEPMLNVEDPELNTLYSQFRAKLSAQELLVERYRSVRKRLAILIQKELELQSEANQAEATVPLLALLEHKVQVAGVVQDPQELYNQLMNKEAQYEVQLRRSKMELEREFSDFRDAIEVRIAKFQELYKSYATAFLGIECFLDQISTGDRLLGLPRFVPRFDGTTRETPEDCSEAQRFFLDIAFRMAMIDWASLFTGAPASFFCETPENALDMSYVDNVVTMFKKFAERNHALLLTANIQVNGFAVKLLEDFPRGERNSRVLNLLDYGQLTRVHEHHLVAMRRVTKGGLT